MNVVNVVNVMNVVNLQIYVNFLRNIFYLYRILFSFLRAKTPYNLLMSDKFKLINFCSVKFLIIQSTILLQSTNWYKELNDRCCKINLMFLHDLWISYYICYQVVWKQKLFAPLVRLTIFLEEAHFTESNECCEYIKGSH